MEFECLICGTTCRLRKGKTLPTQLKGWQEECPQKMDEDGLSWIFSLDLKSLDHERCICRTCCGLLSDLEGYESLARGVRAELLQRHQAGRQGQVLVSDDDLAEEEEPATPEPRRSGRRSGAGASQALPPPPATDPSGAGSSPVLPRPSATDPSGADASLALPRLPATDPPAAEPEEPQPRRSSRRSCSTPPGELQVKIEEDEDGVINVSAPVRTGTRGRGRGRGRPRGRGASARGRGAPARGRGAASRARGGASRGRGSASRGRGAAAEAVGTMETEDDDAGCEVTAVTSGDDAAETVRNGDVSDDDDVVSLPGVEMKDGDVEVILEDSASESDGREGAEDADPGAEDSGSDGGGDAGSDYAPSPATAGGDDGDSSDGGAASDNPRDADYDPTPKKQPCKRGRAGAAAKHDAHDADYDPTPKKQPYKRGRAGAAAKHDARDADYDPTPKKQPYKRASGFNCSRCGLSFKSRLALNSHERRSHSDANGENKCAICHKSFKHRGTLTTHQRMVHGKGERCRHCDKVFRCFTEYYRHLADAHDVKTFVCEHCGAGFAKRVLLNKHMKKEARQIKQQQRMERLRKLKCSVCDYRPPMTQAHRAGTVYTMIRDHEHRAHGMHGALGTDPVAAAAASSGVSALPPTDGVGCAPPTARDGEDFITLTAGGEVAPPAVPEQRFPCQECGLVFGCRRALHKHKYTHKEKVEPPVPPTMVVCEYCGKEFSSHYLKTHQEVVHKIANLFYTCKFCGKQYHKYEKGHYISHLQTKHLMDQQFPCTEPGCGRTFLHERGLRRHVRAVHEMANQCSTCQERFSSLWKRDKHRAEVHGQYDFVCSECGLKFFRRAEMEIHVRRIHTLQLKYQCSVCDTRSEERRKLLNHEHSQHGLHVDPLPENNPAGVPAYPCPSTECRLVFGCGLAVKQHASERHQIKLDIYGKPKIPLSKRSVANGGLARPPNTIGPLLQRSAASDVLSPLLQRPPASDVTNPQLQRPPASDVISPLLQRSLASDVISPLLQQSSASDVISPLLQRSLASDISPVL